MAGGGMTGGQPVTVEHGDLVIAFVGDGTGGASRLRMFIEDRGGSVAATFLVEGDALAALALLVGEVRSRGRAKGLLLTPGEAAAFLHVDPKTLTRWAKAGKVRCIYTAGGHRRYLEEDLVAVARQGAAE